MKQVFVTNEKTKKCTELVHEISSLLNGYIVNITISKKNGQGYTVILTVEDEDNCKQLNSTKPTYYLALESLKRKVIKFVEERA